MRFTETILRGAYLIEPELIGDKRGYFTRMFCEEEFAQHGLASKFPQCNLSFNHQKFTLRVMHYQAGQYAEDKLVMCVNGRIVDAIIDLRKDSETYCKSVSFVLDDCLHKMLYVPKGFAHGYLTLTDRAEVYYQVSSPYKKEAEMGVRFDDPAFNIDWQTYIRKEDLIISDRDLNHLRYIP